MEGHCGAMENFRSYTTQKPFLNITFYSIFKPNLLVEKFRISQIDFHEFHPLFYVIM